MKRSIYLDDYTCETQPCDPTPEGYAAFLAAGGTEDWPAEVPEDGAIFTGSALSWMPDIIATRNGSEWTLSREPSDDDFVAVRFGEGAGWSADNIITEAMAWVDGEYTVTENMAEALRRWLSDNNDFCDDTEYVAVGRYQNGLTFQYRTDPPRLIEETVQ